MKKILLDTNAYSALMSGNKAVFDALSNANVVYVSVIVLSELETGFLGGMRYEANRTLLKKFLSRATVFVIDATQETAEIFGGIKNQLRLAGTPIPLNDIWIASHTVETGSVLVTKDKHFQKIPGL